MNRDNPLDNVMSYVLIAGGGLLLAMNLFATPRPEAAPLTADASTTQPSVADVSPAIDPIEQAVAVEWLFTKSEADAKQAETGKPVLCLVTQDEGCAPCKELEAGPLSDSAVAKWINTNTIPLRQTPKQFVVRGRGTPVFVAIYRGGKAVISPKEMPRGKGFLPWLRGWVKR